MTTNSQTGVFSLYFIVQFCIKYHRARRVSLLVSFIGKRELGLVQKLKLMPLTPSKGSVAVQLSHQ